MTSMYDKAKAVRRRKQAEINSKVKGVMCGLPSHTAKLTFDLTKRDNDKTIDMSKNARIKVVAVVARLLDSFDLPSRPKLDYLGTAKEATSKDGVIEDGIMKVGATLQTLLGHKIAIDIPVIIKKKSILEPAVFFCDGSPFVLCKPALDQLIKRGTLNKEVLERRNLFSPPILDQWLGLDNEQARAPIINRDHMFNPGSRNPWKFRRYSDKVQRERTNIDTPAEFPEIWKGDVEHQLLDPAERPGDDLFSVGEDVALKEDFSARERGGGHLIIPNGEKGEVIRDMKGDGLCLMIKFPDMDITAVVPKRFLKGASTHSEETRVATTTVDQVKNEVRDMLREGYQTVDIKAAVQKRYPELAEEVLSGLDK